jgi:hypothetical protein
MVVKSHQRPEQQQSKDKESKPFHLLSLAMMCLVGTGFSDFIKA